MGTMDTGVTPAATPAPSAPPKPDLNRTMEEYDRLKLQLDKLQTQMQEAATAGDTAKVNALYAQYTPLQTQIETTAQTIEGLGGTTQTAQELEAQSKAALASIDTKIKNAKKKLADAAQLGSFGELPKLTTKLDELKKERTDLMDSFGQKRSVLQEKATNLENILKGELIKNKEIKREYDSLAKVNSVQIKAISNYDKENRISEKMDILKSEIQMLQSKIFMIIDGKENQFEKDLK
jgi:hypothetical protein